MNAFLLPIMDDKEEKKPKGPEIEVETSKYLNSIRLILSNEES